MFLCLCLGVWTPLTSIWLGALPNKLTLSSTSPLAHVQVGMPSLSFYMPPFHFTGNLTSPSTIPLGLFYWQKQHGQSPTFVVGRFQIVFSHVQVFEEEGCSPGAILAYDLFSHFVLIISLFIVYKFSTIVSKVGKRRDSGALAPHCRQKTGKNVILPPYFL